MGSHLWKRSPLEKVGSIPTTAPKKYKKSLDKAQNLCYNKDTKGEGSATREELADPRESVRHSPKTPTAWSPVVRYISVNQALRTQPQTAGRGTAGRGKKIFLKKYLTFLPGYAIIIPERERTP